MGELERMEQAEFYAKIVLIVIYLISTIRVFYYGIKCYYDVRGHKYGKKLNLYDLLYIFVPVVNTVMFIFTFIIPWEKVKFTVKSNHKNMTNEATTYTHKELGTTEIDISGKRVKVLVSRLESGNIEITPLEHRDKEGDFLWDGTCTEGFNDEIIISKWYQ